MLAKKLKRGRGNKRAGRICGRILAEFYQKVVEKGSKKISKRSSLFNDTDTLSEAKNIFNLISN
jgi:hypothetical protein